MNWLKVLKKFGKGLVGGAIAGSGASGLSGEFDPQFVALITALTGLVSAFANVVKHWKGLK